MRSTAKPVDIIINSGYEQLRRTPVATISKTKQWQLYLIALLLVDILMNGVAFLAAYYLRFVADIPIFRLQVVPSFPFYQSIAIGLLLLWTVVFAFYGLYNRRNLLGDIKEYSLVFRATTLSLLLVIIAGFLEPNFVLARGWLLLAWILASLFVIAGRFFLRRVIYSLRRYGYFLSPAIIVGANEEGRSLAQQLGNWRRSGLYIVGFIDDRFDAGATIVNEYQTLGTTDELDRFIVEYGIEELIIATSSFSREEIVFIFEQFGMVKNLNLRLSSGFFETITTGLEVTEMGSVPLVCVNKLRLKRFERTLKFLLDYAITIPLLLLLSPLFIALIIIIKLDSTGPAIYRRKVMGIHGKKFDAFKFRTMYANGDEILEQYPNLIQTLSLDHKLKEDPRITPVGSFLRQWSLDEFPQLFNILKRDMSLVGPRIIAPNEMEKYKKWGANLLTVHPGLSGLWQVSGRSDLSYEDRVRLDMHYIRNWTIWLDMRILFQTISAVTKKRGAY